MAKAKITRDLIIAAMALRCPCREDEGVSVRCVDLAGHETNCNPRLCTFCTDIFKDMAKIASGEINNPLD